MPHKHMNNTNIDSILKKTPKGSNIPLTALGFIIFFYLMFAVKQTPKGSQTPHLIMHVLSAFVAYAVKGRFGPLGSFKLGRVII